MNRAAERYALLLKQIGEEMDHRRGWQRKTAALLGVHRSYVSRFISGTLTSVGPEVIRRAVERLPISSDFFYAETVGHYTDALTRCPPASPTEPDIAAQVAAMRVLASLDDDDRAQVLAWANRRWPS